MLNVGSWLVHDEVAGAGIKFEEMGDDYLSKLRHDSVGGFSIGKLPNNIRDFSYNVIFAVEFLNYNGLKYHQKFID